MVSSFNVFLGPSEMYQQYTEELKGLLLSVKKDVGTLSVGQHDPLFVDNIREDLKKAQTCIKQMESELKTMPPSGAHMAHIRRQKAEVHEMSKQLDTIDMSKRRESALMRNPNRNPDVVARESELLRLQADNVRRLEDSKHVAEETENTALTVLGTLTAQGERLKDVRDNVHGVDNNISTGSQLFTTLRRRVFANKALLWLIIILEIVAAIVILVFKLKKNK
eukprot:GDKK01033124.1.p1 GENE.GDKK01033124.1~~GDKK01033124.1.p1  ORF type:complete len:222 (+),score=29.62 GDKK01033124.1:9-674(+)